MEPLVSPTLESRAAGALLIAAGAVFVVVFLRGHDAVATLVSVAVTASVWIVLMERLVVRRSLGPALAAATQIDDAVVEPSGRAVIRSAVPVLLLLVPILAVIALIAGGGPGGAMLVGQGIVMLRTARASQRWERAGGRRLLRERQPLWTGLRRRQPTRYVYVVDPQRPPAAEAGSGDIERSAADRP